MSTLKSSALQRSLVYRAKMYTAQAGLKCKFGNYTPATDGKVVWFPRLPLGPVDPDTITLFDHWVIHEALGHGRYTNFAALEATKEEFKADKRLHGVWNAIEDPRIEKCGIAYLPGTALALRAGLEVMNQKGYVKSPKANPATALQMYILHWGRLFMLGHTEVEQHYHEARAEVAQLLGDSGMARMEALISSEYDRLKSTEDAIGLAKRVLSLVEEIAEEQENTPEPGSDQGDSSDSSQEDDGESGDAGEDEDAGESGSSSSGDEEDDAGESGDSSSGGEDEEDGEEGDDSSSSQGGTGDDQDGDEDAQADDSPDGDSGDQEDDASEDDKPSGARQILESEPESADPDETVEALIEALQEEIEKVGGSSSAYDDGESTVVHEDGCDPVNAYENESRYEKARADTSAQVATLRQQLVALLQAQARRHKVTGSRGRMSGRLMHRAMVGNDNFRRKKHEELMPVSPVSLLVDLSGSMNIEREALAQQSLIAVAEACNAVGVPLEIFGFGGDNGNAGGLVEIKPFNGGFQQAKARLGGYIANSGGLTPMGEAMLEAGMRLVAQPATRHTMMVLTDGMPNNRAYTENVIALLESGGVQTLGIGVQSDAVASLFSRYSVVNNLDNLGRDVLSLLRGAILDAA